LAVAILNNNSSCLSDHFSQQFYINSTINNSYNYRIAVIFSIVKKFVVALNNCKKVLSITSTLLAFALRFEIDPGMILTHATGIRNLCDFLKLKLMIKRSIYGIAHHSTKQITISKDRLTY